MISREVVIANALGLHARAAARFVQVASRFKCRVQLMHEGRTADGKSILGLLTLIGAPGTRLTIRAEGIDETDALRALADLVEARFGESR